MYLLARTLVHVTTFVGARAVAPGRDRERGDVPGWVLITLMTATIVAAIWVFARDQLMDLVSRALNDVVPGNDGGGADGT